MFSENEIIRIFKYYLHMNMSIRLIRSIFLDNVELAKYIYDSYFQRSYVWSLLDKAPHLIESIIIGAEIPPITVFIDSNGHIILDGRQRFETVARFLNNEFALSSKGMTVLKEYHGKYYSDLPADVQNAILNAKIRIFQFDAINEKPINEGIKEYITLDIFKRCNKNIVPLKGYEVDRAKFIKHDLIIYLKEKITNDNKFYIDFTRLFLSKGYWKKIINDIDVVELILRKIRYLTVLSSLPLYFYTGNPDKKKIVDRFFKNISQYVDKKDKFYENLKDNIELLKKYNNAFIKMGMSADYKVFEALYWVISIFKQENIDTEKIAGDHIIKEFIDLVKNCDENFYKKTKHRYEVIAEFFSKRFDINFDIYILYDTEFRNKAKNILEDTIDSKPHDKTNNERIAKTIPTTMTINDLITQVENNMYLLRPIFQRKESKDIKKASSIIESALLGMPIGVIYVYVDKNGVYQVIDGQQRILSFLGYLSIDYINEKGQKDESCKKGFKLEGLELLKSLNGKTFEELNIEQIEQLMSYKLYIIEINQNMYPDFDPVDLFMRLNNKSYQILPNTFEMWNAMLNKSVTSKIKNYVKRYAGWYYLKTSEGNKRMKNEELYTTLAILDGYYNCGRIKEILQTIVKDNGILVVRLKSRCILSNYIASSNDNSLRKKEILKGVENVEKYIKKIELLLSGKNKTDSKYLTEEFNKLFGLPLKERQRTLQMHYLLWYLVTPIPENTIVENKDEIKRQINKIVEKTKKSNTTDAKNILDDLKINQKLFVNKHTKSTPKKVERVYNKSIKPKHNNSNKVDRTINNASNARIDIKNTASKKINNIQININDSGRN